MPTCIICQTDKHSSEFFAPLARITICKDCTGHNKKNVNNLIMRDEIASNKEIMRQKIDAELLAKTPLFYQDLAEKLGTTENAIENRAAVLRKEGKIGYRSTANKNKGKTIEMKKNKKEDTAKEFHYIQSLRAKGVKNLTEQECEKVANYDTEKVERMTVGFFSKIKQIIYKSKV